MSTQEEKMLENVLMQNLHGIKSHGKEKKSGKLDGKCFSKTFMVGMISEDRNRIRSRMSKKYFGKLSSYKKYMFVIEMYQHNVSDCIISIAASFCIVTYHNIVSRITITNISTEFYFPSETLNVITVTDQQYHKNYDN